MEHPPPAADAPPVDAPLDRERFVLEDLACRRCFANLRGVELVRGCPACGLPVVTSIATRREQVFDAAGVLVAEVECRQCGYNLRGLHREQRCPECGTDVAISAGGDWLAFAAPRFVRGLANGARLFSIGLHLLVITLVVAPLIAMTLAASEAPSLAFAVLVLVSGLVGFAGVVLMMLGLFLLTTPDPARTARESRLSARRLARLGPVVLGGLIILNAISSAAGPPAVVHLVNECLSTALLGAVLISMGAFFRWMAHLADRLPDRRLAERFRTLVGSMLVPLGLMLGAAQARQLVAAAQLAFAPAVVAGLPVRQPMVVLSAWLQITACFLMLGAILVLIMALVWIRAQTQLGRAVALQARIAAAHWRHVGSKRASANSAP